jgi:tetratricopeptide (TPR) repeat protein
MEYVPGEPIIAYCDRHRLSISQRLKLFEALCEGVQHAHQKGIIHRDLKPSNVLVTLQDEQPVPRIIDFGVAKATSQSLTDRSLFTQIGALIGTPEYMSPEQAELTPLDVDTRSDIYSLGIVLYELLVGVLPFDAARFRRSGLDEIRRIIREEEAPRPSLRVGQSEDSVQVIAARRRSDPAKLPRLLRGDLDWIVLKALEKDRTRRYQTANGFALDIRRHLNDEPVAAGPPRASYRLNKFVRRHRVGVTLAASIALLLFLFTVGMAVQAQRVAREAARANEAEAEARVEAANATAVVEFLQNDLLAQASAATQANPATAPDPDIKVRTALDRAAEAVGQRFNDRPRVEASIRDTIGETYLGLGLYPEAERQLERSLELRRHELGDVDPETIGTMSSLGDVYRQAGKYALAEPLLKEAVENGTRFLSADHDTTLTSMGNLAIVYRNAGKYAEAEALYVQVLDKYRRIKGGQNVGTLTNMNNFGILLLAQGKNAAAEEQFAETVRLEEIVLGRAHPKTMIAINNLALAYLRRGKFEDSEVLFVEMLEWCRRVWGPRHPGTLTAEANLADVYRMQGRFVEAEALYREAMSVGRIAQGDTHPNTLLTLHKVALLYRDTGRIQQASVLADTVLESRRRVLGEQHPDTLTTRESVAEISMRQGKYRTAESLLMDVLASRRQVLTPEHPDTLRTVVLISEVQFAEQKYAEAESRLRELARLYEERGTQEWSRYHCLSLLGGVLVRQGHYSAAEPLLSAGHDGFVKSRKSIPASWSTIITRNATWLAELYRGSGQPEKAHAWLVKTKELEIQARRPY